MQDGRKATSSDTADEWADEVGRPGHRWGIRVDTLLSFGPFFGTIGQDVQLVAVLVERVSSMARKVSAAEAKSQLSSLVARVAHGREHFLIERRGKPLAALVGVDDLERLERYRATSERPLGALALTGAWAEVDDADLDCLIDELYRIRENDAGRPVEMEPRVSSRHRRSQ